MQEERKKNREYTRRKLPKKQNKKILGTEEHEFRKACQQPRK